MHRRHIRTIGLGLAFTIGAIGNACSSSTDGSGKGGRGADGGRFNPNIGFEGGLFRSLDASTLSISPANPEITVNPLTGKPDPITFIVTGAGSSSVEWIVSNPNLGTIDQNGVFTPSGLAGGEGYIEVHVGNAVAKVHIVVHVAAEQNGATTASLVDAGAGGLGGVGGEGLGGAVPDDLLAVLKGTPGADAAVGLLYPYDETVFPLGILPPLYQWSPGGNGHFDAIYVHLSSPPFYDYKGYFGRPAALAAGADFVRHSIPKEVWKAATESAAGSTLKVEVVLAAGGKAYGPLTQSYKIALAPFNGVVYYQAYATAFVENQPELTVWGGRFGGATLSIDVGAERPTLVAGATSDDKSGCRVCHSVSAYGDRMVVQHGNDYTQTASIDLKNGNLASDPYRNGTLGWAGLYPDGSMGLANSIDVTGSDSNQGDTRLYDMTNGAVIPSPGLNEFATQIGLPAFSPDGKHAAFTLFAGPSTAAIGPANGRKLVVMDFDLATKTFSNPRLLWDSMANDQRPAFNTFMPDSDAVMFQHRWDNGDLASSWHGSRAQLWWVDLATRTPHLLDRANGIGADGKRYIPTGPNQHDQDERLNYDPSISPVASGGYAWMVFMSRRLYGNVATSGPWETDPRNFDIRTNIATKKLWMTAIDLNAKAGTDPSHPAFYIPGQELKGINSRPFVTLQPCVTDRGTCRTGVDCCTGFCRDGLCRPQIQNECSKIDEKCATAADCCDAAARCVGGFCAIILK
jgi:hypothetical protein